MDRPSPKKLRIAALVLMPMWVAVMACWPSSHRSEFRTEGHAWVIPTYSLNRLKPLTDFSMVRSYLDRHATYVACYVPIQPCRRLRPENWKGGLLLPFTSYADVHQLLEDSLPVVDEGEVSGLVYDTDRWPLTAPEEQEGLGRFTQLSSSLARQRGLPFLSAPGIGLFRAPANPSPPGRIIGGYRNYLRSGVIGTIARYSDVLVVQAQGLGADPTMYRWFVEEAARIARKANPEIAVVPVIATSVSGHPVEPTTLLRDVLLTWKTVDGYWLNIPANDPSCLWCEGTHPEVAAQLFRLLDQRRP